MNNLIKNSHFAGIPDPPFSVMFVDPPQELKGFCKEGEITEFIVTSFIYRPTFLKRLSLKLLGIKNQVIIDEGNIIVDDCYKVESRPAIMANGLPDALRKISWMDAVNMKDGSTANHIEAIKNTKFKPLLPG